MWEKKVEADRDIHPLGLPEQRGVPQAEDEADDRITGNDGQVGGMSYA